MPDAAAENLGVSIKKCTEFIGAVHAEAHLLLLEISGVIEKHDFESITGSSIRVSETSTKNITIPTGWCHRVVARLFGKGGRDRVSTRLLAVEVHFAPSFEIDQAVLVMGCARFVEAQDKDALLNGYGDFMATLYGDEAPELGAVKKRVPGSDSVLFPKAEEVRVVGWPLVSFDSAEKVKNTITAALRDLGAIDAQ